jgi:DNA invertase Pin-like site-specific DNA recombinase
MLIGYARTSTLEQGAGLEAQLVELKAYGCDEGLARSVRHLGELLELLAEKHAGLVILSMGGQQIDTTTATGKMLLNVMASVAQFEREMMLERQREGIAKAKAEGKYMGRKPTAMEKSEAVLSLLKTGMSKTDVCRQVGVSRASLYRILAKAEASEA